MELLDLSSLSDDLLPQDINERGSGGVHHLLERKSPSAGNSPINGSLFPGLSGHPLSAVDLSASSDSLLMSAINTQDNSEEGRRLSNSLVEIRSNFVVFAVEILSNIVLPSHITADTSSTPPTMAEEVELSKPQTIRLSELVPSLFEQPIPEPPASPLAPPIDAPQSMADSFLSGISPNISPNRGPPSPSKSVRFSSPLTLANDGGGTPTKNKSSRSGSPISDLLDAQRALESMKQRLQALKSNSPSSRKSSPTKSSPSAVILPPASRARPEINSEPQTPSVRPITFSIAASNPYKSPEKSTKQPIAISDTVTGDNANLNAWSPVKSSTGSEVTLNATYRDTDSTTSSSHQSSYVTAGSYPKKPGLTRMPSRLRSPSKNKSAFKPVAIGMDQSRESSPRKPSLDPAFQSAFADQLTISQEQDLAVDGSDSTEKPLSAIFGKAPTITQTYRPVLSAAKINVGEETLVVNPQLAAPPIANCPASALPQQKLQHPSSLSASKLTRSKSIFYTPTVCQSISSQTTVSQDSKAAGSSLKRSGTRIPLPKSRPTTAMPTAASSPAKLALVIDKSRPQSASSLIERQPPAQWSPLRWSRRELTASSLESNGGRSTAVRLYSYHVLQKYSCI